jgi:cell division septal protein FtsQ
MLKGKSSPYLARRAKKFKRVKKDYQHKTLHNPFFHKRQAKPGVSKNKFRRYFVFFFIILIFSALLYLFCFSPLFSLRQVKIEGVSRIPEAELADFAWQQSQGRQAFLFKQSNLLFFQEETLAAALSENFSFDSLRVYKRWPHTLVISAGERSLAFIWRDKSGQSFSDSRGCLVPEASLTEADIANYAILEASSDLDYLDNKDCLEIDEAYLRALFALYEKMKSYPELKVNRFLLEGAFNTLKADLASGPNILFNVKEDLDKQLNKLVIIKQEQDQAQFNALEYIDLRYGDRAYFK